MSEDISAFMILRSQKTVSDVSDKLLRYGKYFRFSPFYGIVLISWQSNDYLPFLLQAEDFDLFWLSSRPSLQGTSHPAKDISVQTIPVSLDRRKNVYVSNPNLQLLLGFKGMSLFLMFDRYLLSAISVTWISLWA